MTPLRDGAMRTGISLAPLDSTRRSYSRDNDSLSMPTSCSEQAEEGENKTFHCKICLIELNSQDTMTSHKKGVKHMKKGLALAEEKKQK